MFGPLLAQRNADLILFFLFLPLLIRHSQAYLLYFSAYYCLFLCAFVCEFSLLFQVSGAERDRWEFPRHRLQFVCILGEGCFGQVWKAHILGQEESKPVAVKTLKGQC